VQFYDDDSILIDGLGRTVGSALGAGDAAIVIATKAHRLALATRLEVCGGNVAMASGTGRYLALDAAETLSSFMVDGWPDTTRFTSVIGEAIAQAKAATGRAQSGVVAFGEMVALLWTEGNAEAAIRLEQLWNELAETQAFSLHCAYPLGSFVKESDGGALQRICSEHSHVIPSESYTALKSDDEKLRTIALLQQKALALQALAEENARLYLQAQQEIAQRKQAQEALIQAEKLAATGRLAATIAHEINNPLEAVVNYIYLAKRTPGVPEKVTRHLNIADQELARISNIAQQTLGFYRDNSRPVKVSLVEAVQSVLTIYERKLRYKSLQLHVDVPTDLEIFTLQGELKQAISNLLANSIDASRPDGTIWVNARRSRDWRHTGRAGISITVADNGTGMSAEVQDKVFTPFFTTKEQVGTGLGLWTTRNMLAKQEGFIRMRSRQGPTSGTVMSIFLPFLAEPKDEISR
jgi:signal transduction histidine kinase